MVQLPLAAELGRRRRQQLQPRDGHGEVLRHLGFLHALDAVGVPEGVGGLLDVVGRGTDAGDHGRRAVAREAVS